MKRPGSDFLKIKTTKGFLKDLERDKKSGKYTPEDFEKLKDIIKKLQGKEPIESVYRRHKLKGRLRGYEALHIKNDWILIFKIEDPYLVLVMLGTHSQVYKM